MSADSRPRAVRSKLRARNIILLRQRRRSGACHRRLRDPTGGARSAGERRSTLQVHESRQRVGRYVPGLRGAGSNPGGVPRTRHASHIPAGNIFQLISAMQFPAIVCETAQSTLNKWKVKVLAPKPACSKCYLERAAMAFAERVLASRLGLRPPAAGISSETYPVDTSHPHEPVACA